MREFYMIFARKIFYRIFWGASVPYVSYTYDHLQNLRMANLLRTPANKLQHANAERAHDARLHCRLMSPF